MSNYQKLSVMYYDESKPIGSAINNDLSFYHHHIIDAKQVLEAGVGTGRLLIPFLKKGIQIEGVDLSEEMVSLCKKKCVEHGVSTRVLQGDVETLLFGKTYDAIIIPTGTFCLFQHIETVISNFEKHLSEKGVLLFDLIFPTDFKSGQSFTYPLDLGDDKHLILTDIHVEINWNKQETKELLRYDLWEKGKIIETELETFVLNWYSVNEIVNILHEQGFKKIELFGDYTENYSSNENYEVVSVKAFK